jgi:hypothetical protein
MFGPNPMQERFRLATYYLFGLAFQTSGAEPLAWGEFMEWYTTMYPHGQPGLPDDLVTAYVNNSRATGAAPGSTVGDSHKGPLITEKNTFLHKIIKTQTNSLSYGPPWAHCIGGYQDRLLGGPLGLPGLRCTAPEGVEHKDYTGVVLG